MTEMANQQQNNQVNGVEDSWIVVETKGKRLMKKKKNGRPSPVLCHSVVRVTASLPEKNANKFSYVSSSSKDDGRTEENTQRGNLQLVESGVKTIRGLVLKMIEENEFYIKLKQAIEDAIQGRGKRETAMDIVCYGTGCFSNSRNARVQLACALSLRKSTSIPPGKILLFDPVLNEVDKTIAREFGVELISVNENCRRKVDATTLFFMPHCGMELYENLLSANWPHGLSNLLVFGNSFSAYEERLISKIERDKSLVLRSLPYLYEINCAPSNSKSQDFHIYYSAFNDTSLHVMESFVEKTTSNARHLESVSS